jgi:multicomponent K+:H+ antiporter subunit A
VLIRRDLFAIFALGASSLSIAVLMVLEPTPDVALVQIVVDILTTVILVLALTRIPYARREAARQLNDTPGRFGPLGAGVVAAGLGMVMSLVVFAALSSRPRVSQVTPYYEQNSDPLTGAHDIVGAIVVDFRGFDTMIEITVFSMAGLAMFSLLTYAAKKHNDADTSAPDAPVDAGEPLTPRVIRRDLLDIAGLRTSPFVRMLAYTTLPLTLMIAFTHMIYGHAQPGDGFTAGVIISLGVGFWYIVLGYEHTKQRLTWLRPLPLMASGILLVMAGSVAPTLMGGSFFAPVDFGKLWGLPLPAGFYLSTSFLFEVAICLAVLGSATLMIDTLGRPQGEL